MVVAVAAAVTSVVSAGLAAWLLTAPVSSTCGIASLPGLSRQFAPTAMAVEDPSPAGALADLLQLASSILGEAATPGVDVPTRTDLPCSPEVRARDHHAWKMAMVGYSAKEIADVLDGHLTRADLDQARARLMAGQSPAIVANFLDARWREPIVEAQPVERIGVEPDTRPFSAFEPELTSLAQQHRVPAELVRAMVSAESGGNARAVSTAGAIGLLQLMPATAAALGVDPWQPAENLRGGIAYMAELLRAFDNNVRLALIAYNAGPQHASRVRAGTAVPYRETRRYLDAIAARYPLP